MFHVERFRVTYVYSQLSTASTQHPRDRKQSPQARIPAADMAAGALAGVDGGVVDGTGISAVAVLVDVVPLDVCPLGVDVGVAVVAVVAASLFSIEAVAVDVGEIRTVTVVVDAIVGHLVAAWRRTAVAVVAVRGIANVAARRIAGLGG